MPDVKINAITILWVESFKFDFFYTLEKYAPITTTNKYLQLQATTCVK